jgi:SAM-dependent methyltransferase
MVLSNILYCPNCQSRLSEKLACNMCTDKSLFIDNTFIAKSTLDQSYFDQCFETMIKSNHEIGSWNIFYKDQINFFSSSIKPGDIVLDIGCGPEIPYSPPDNCFLIGLDPSYLSIKSNQQIKFGIFGDAAKIPIFNNSIDKIVCFYSLHHMTGHSVDENVKIVTNVFNEFNRILSRSGELIIFDVSPVFPFNIFQNITWNAFKAKIGGSLDMFFWKDSHLKGLSAEILKDFKYSKTTFKCKSSEMFSPIFNLPSLKIPRLLYPFNINAYKWSRSN